MIRTRTFAAFALVGILIGGAAVVLGWTPRAALPTDGLAETPPMGFNNWTVTQCNRDFNEWMIKEVADSMVTLGLRDAGYEYVNLDDCWALPARDDAGKLVADQTRFPSGIKALADYVHERGLKFGIYSSAGTATCDPHGFPGGLGHEVQDANQFADWGIDYLKYDNCNNQGVDAQTRYRTMREALRATGRPIVLSICDWGQSQPWTWPLGTGHLWRTGGDIEDAWSSVVANVHQTLAAAPYVRPANWADPDALQTGNGGMTADQYQSQFSLWAVMAAPLLVGSDPRHIAAEALAILKNADVIAVDQDEMGRSGRVVSTDGGTYVIAKPLADGDLALALFNETSSAASITANVTESGLNWGRYLVKDLWSKEIRLATGDTLTADVPAYSTVFVRLSPIKPRPAGRWSLSEAVPTRSVNGLGPAETDRANGEGLAGDGHGLHLGDESFRHGIGVHAPSELEYYLGGTCSTLTATVGVDREVHGEGSVEFHVYADGNLVANSGLMTRSSRPKPLQVNIAGAQYAKLVVTDGGDNVEFDHGDWANPVVECS